ncbi:phosphonate C-P lyase system protein PhnH [Methylobacterium sp. J-070]|uniref:phosphonate C-P lyase system protein PhnH n=1 Tax=Methylobacterium sp. J-070 TaxID=2836650 RepID=UPI001FBAD212|nr:phosphonate C-P lyase system protein PhnH [Methylobacterium sp. J-070]MCJ2050625.1 phosphonate C-P lyase system protein PhnH [Methylobacterium sp. J-070]
MLAPGFADPVHDAQGTFRAVMDALARPGQPRPLAPGLTPPAPLTPELAAVALALTDADTPVWLDAALAAAPDVAAYLRFHTGAPLTDDPAQAAFALIRDPGRCPPLGRFAPGTPAYPDTSTTLVLACEAITEGEGLHLAGPGIAGTVRLAAAPLPEGFVTQLAANRADFPLGVDLILTAPGRVAGLPRSTAVSEG